MHKNQQTTVLNNKDTVIVVMYAISYYDGPCCYFNQNNIE